MSENWSGEERGDLFSAVTGQHPLVDGDVDVVELSGLDEDGRHGGGTASDEFEVAERGKEGCAATGFILPALSDLEAEGLEEAAQLVQPATRCDAGGDCMDERDSLDHGFDCIVCNRWTLRWSDHVREVERETSTGGKLDGVRDFAV